MSEETPIKVESDIKVESSAAPEQAPAAADPAVTVKTEDVKQETVEHTNGNQATALDKKLVRQVEFYFSDYNMHRDKFMKEHMKQNEGWFTMNTMLKFQRLASICSEPGTILAALKNSKSKLVEVDIEGMAIRRNVNRPLPENNAKYARELTQRSVYVKGFPQTETIEDITEFLEDFGTVDGIHLRKFNNPHTGSIFKGSLIASFSTYEEANRFLQAPMVYYKDQELEKMSKEDFLNSKEGEKQQRSNKKNKKNQQDEEDEENVEMCFIHVANLDDEGISHIDVKRIFEDLEIPPFKFFSRYEKNGPEGYIVYLNVADRDTAMKVLQEKHEDGVMRIKAAEKVQFTTMPEDKKETAEESYKEFRATMLKRKSGGGRGGGRGGRGGRGRNKRSFGGGNRNQSRGGGRKNTHIKFGDDEPSHKMAKSEE